MFDIIVAHLRGQRLDEKRLGGTNMEQQLMASAGCHLSNCTAETPDQYLQHVS